LIFPAHTATLLCSAPRSQHACRAPGRGDRGAL